MQTPQIPKPNILTISQLNFYVKSRLDGDPLLSSVFVTGEISNLKDHYSSGHIYFSLKDKGAVINSVMFRFNAVNLRFKPEEGMKVIARGRVSLYEQNGSYQLYVEDMFPDGIGALTQAFEQLKRKLEKEGLFDKARKKPVPRFPETVGVITSPTGAAVQDIRNILTRRFPGVNIVLAPVLVQGEGAPAQLVRAVKLFNEHDAADVIIIGRGGGSIEDLWAFNSEELAYAIYDSHIPVVSAVGHETDFTICDFVSDLRAPTPSAAAELCVPDSRELKNYYLSQRQYLSSLMDSRLIKAESSLNSKRSRIARVSPDRNIRLYEQRLEALKKTAETAVNNRFDFSSQHIKNLGDKLISLNPFSVLQRGYSFAEKDGKIVASVSDLKPGDRVKLTLKDGYVNTEILEN